MAGSYELVINGLLGGVPVLNRLHFLTPSEGDNSLLTAESIANYFTDVLSAAYLDCVPESYEMGTVVARGIVVVNGGSYTTVKTVDASQVSSPGTRTGEVSSNATGPILEFVPNLEGFPGARQRVGKMYLPGISEADAGANVISSGALLVNLGVLLADLVSNWTLGIGFDAVLSVLSQITDQYLLDLADYHVRTWLAQQRRRRPPHES